ncbi:hypothetical protein C8233_00790 [Halomonas sp. SF2003]|nr:hypothetical protein C8233_00790 [Halomonas sp. SF2003]
MSERMAEISAHIDSVRQLGSVVNAIKGIAAARARNARAEVQAVDRYSAVIVEAVVSAFGHDIATCTHDTREQEPASDDASTGWLLFLAEQGFAGAFSERLLDSLGTALGSAPLMAVGTRGLSILAAREITPLWSAPMPSHSPGIPALADTLTTVIHDQLSKGHFERLELVYTRWEGGHHSGYIAACCHWSLRASRQGVPRTRAYQRLTPLPDHGSVLCCNCPLRSCLSNFIRMWCMPNSAKRHCTPSPPRTRRACKPWPPPPAK